MVRDWTLYVDWKDVFDYLSSCTYYEPWSNGESTGFKLYESCGGPQYFRWRYALAMLGGDVPADKPWHYLVGYCPAIANGDFLVAKTLLTPGMSGTPEHDWYLRKVGRTKRDRDELHSRASKLTYSELTLTRDFSLLKQFHDGGMSQVVELHDQVFSAAC